MKGLMYLLMELEELKDAGSAKEALRTIDMYYKGNRINTDTRDSLVRYIRDSGYLEEQL